MTAPREVVPGETTAQDVWAMRLALTLAREAARLGEIPVGAVVVRGGQLISQAFNLRETLRDPTAHAERLALTLAGQALGTWRLDGCSIVVTLEPCPMCAGAIVQSRLSAIVYGARDPKAGAIGSLYRLAQDRRLNHRCQVRADVLKDQCGEILKGFFQERRASRDNN